MAWNPAADEQRFREDVAIGDRWVQKVAGRLAGLGLWNIDVPKVQVRGHFDGRRAYRDDGDLFLNGHRIEVRSLAFKFTGPHDYPHRTVLVELKTVMPHKANTVAYLFVSRPTGAVIGLFGSDLKHLKDAQGVYNQRRGVARDWLVGDVRRLRSFEDTVNYLAERCQG
jgi:hypothetical protein